MRPNQQPALFPALLKHWRGHRGLSQLDLALTADVSARHVSFLETGRSQPSREMVLRLATALSMPLRDQNQLLVAAGHEEAFAETPDDPLSGPLGDAIARMLAHQEPYPMVVMDRGYDIVRMNRAAARVLGCFVAEPAALGARPNGFAVLFDPRLARPFIEEWPRAARTMLARLHREALERPNDVALRALLRTLFAMPDVPADWQTPDLSAPSEPVLAVRLRRGELAAGFITTLTVFNAPQNVTAEELRIESYFPSDEATAQLCQRLASDDP